MKNNKIQFIKIKPETRKLYRLKAYVFRDFVYQSWRKLDGVYAIKEEKNDFVDVGIKNNNLMPQDNQPVEYIQSNIVVIKNIRTGRTYEIDKHIFENLFMEI